MKHTLVFLLKTLRILVLTALGSALLTTLLLLYVLNDPGRFITPNRVRLASILGQERLSHHGVNVTWSELKLKVESKSFFKKSLALELSNPCFHSPELNACFSSVSFNTRTDLGKLAVTEIGPISILGGTIKYQSASSPAVGEQKSAPPEQVFRLSLPSILSGAAFKPVQIQIKSLDYQNGSYHWMGKISLDSKQKRSSDFSILFKLAASAQSQTRTRPFPATAKLDIQGELGPIQFKSKFGFALNHFNEQIPKVKATDCEVELDFGQGARLAKSLRRSDHLNLNCPFDVHLPELPISVSQLDVPKLIKLALRLQSDGQYFPTDLSREIEVQTQLEVLPFSTSTFTGHGLIDASYVGKIDNLPHSKDLHSTMNFALRVPQFKNLVRKLDRGVLEVPAPIRTMNGSIEFSTQGKLEDLQAKYPLTFVARLSSMEQKLNLDGDGSFQVDLKSTPPALHAGINLNFSEVRLILPRLELATPPQILADNRIGTEETIRKERIDRRKSKKPTSFHYDVAIATPPTSPIKIITNLARGPIPIHLDLKMSDDNPIAGNIKVDSFPLELFRRDATLDHFNMSLKSPIDQSPIDGSFNVKYTDYVIHVGVISTVARPVIVMTSDPPLPQDKLLATLLFGHPLNELDETQSSSVGNAQAAITDGAIGLGSMYVLASTPVESVSYDSKSGVVTARVKLAEGTSLNVGTDSSAISRVGVRKRLGKYWAVETDLNQGSSNALSSGTRGSLFFEYSARY